MLPVPSEPREPCIYLIALHNGFSKPLIIRLYFRKLQIKKKKKRLDEILVLKGPVCCNECIASSQHRRSFTAGR